MRRKDREVTDLERIKEILAKAKIVHVAMFDEEFPYVVPLHYGYIFENEQFILYMHGASEGHKIDLIHQNPKVCFEIECEVEAISGGEVACRYGSRYASIIGHGKAEIVEDINEKINGLKLLMKAQTGRDFVFDEQMAASVAVIKITVFDYSAKSRSMSKTQ